MNRNTRILGCIFAITVLLGAVSVPAQEVEFNYNGRVKVNGLMFSGQGQFKFALVSKDGEATFWTNDGLTTSTSMPTATVTVDVTDGFFSVNIGDAELPGMAALTKDVFARDEDMYLRVWFNDGTRGFEMLTPDRKITNTDLLGLKISKIKDYIIYINGATGNDKHLGLTPEKPKKTIQSAIDSLPPLLKCNVTIDIADGVYREQVNIIGINATPGKKLTLLGDDSWTTASVGDPAVRITGVDNDADPILVRKYAVCAQQCTGLRLVGLFLDRSTGVRVFFSSCASWEISGCKIVDTDRRTTGVYAESCGYGTISNCLVTGNQTGIGTRNSVLDVESVRSEQNGYGLGVNSGLVGISNVRANNNTNYGVLVSGGGRTDVMGNCEFSNNGGDGFAVELSAAVVFYQGAAWGPRECHAQVTNNHGYGLFVAAHGVVLGYPACTFSGNGSGSTYVVTGGGLYRTTTTP